MCPTGDTDRSSSPQETYSSAEKAFDLWRRRTGLWAGPAVALLVAFLPLSIPVPAHRLAALMAGMVIYWITEPIPLAITALLGPIVAILLGIGTDKEVIASFGNPVLFLFIGSFILARAMEKHRLDRRFSFWLLSKPFIENRPSRILFSLGAVTALLSMWISNTAATAMIFPIALGVLREFHTEDSNRSVYATRMMLMIAFAASVGGIGTPVGTPPNLIGIGMIEKEIGRTISFFEWMQLGVPMVLVMFLFLYGLLSWRSLPERSDGMADFIEKQKSQLGGWSRGEKNTLIAFVVAVLLWIAPGLLGVFLGSKHPFLLGYNKHLPEGGVAILAASLLFLLSVDRERTPTLTWNDAVQIDWGTILLFGGGLAMGDLLFKTGLSTLIGESLLSLLSIQSLWGITGFSIALAIVISELSSNTASANMVIPVVIGLAVASGVDPIPPALGATLGASFGFMLPISTPPNAIVYGSGFVPIRSMIRTGIGFDLIGFLLIWGGLRILYPLLG
jgi:sodium-dependent dicarboxylate transporter 2/3/5